MSRMKPCECQSIDEIRKQIDAIDKKIISLFAERHGYVEEIVKHKTNEEGIVAQERKDFVISERSRWAGEVGLNEELFKTIFTELINHNIAHEMGILQRRKSAQASRKIQENRETV